MPPVPPRFERWRERGFEHARSSFSLAHSVGQRLARGLTVLFPIAATLGLLWWIFVLIDNLVPTQYLFGREIRGAGFGLVLLLALVAGLIAGRPWGRAIIARVESAMLRIPLVRLLFSTFRDFVHAFFGRRKRFDKPVLVRLAGGFDAEVIGFITRENLDTFGILDKVAVYFPQSYNIGGNVLILPRDRLTPIEADSAVVMTFLVTGGVASMEGPPESTGAVVPKLVPRVVVKPDSIERAVANG